MAALAVLLTFASLLGLTTPAAAQSSEPQTIASDVLGFWLTPAGDRVVYQTRETWPHGEVRLHSAPVAGGTPTLIDVLASQLWQVGDNDVPPPEFFVTGSEPQSAIRFSPDSERMAYLRDGRIVVASIADGQPVELTDDRVGSVIDFVMTPDWETAVFVAGHRGKPFRLYSVPLSGGRPVHLARLGSEVADFHAAALTPDATRVVYMTSARSISALRSVPVDGGRPIDLHESRNVMTFAIAPDGRVVFVGAQQRATFESPYFLYASSPNHRRAKRITPDPVPGHVHDAHITISADGRSVLYEDDVAPRRGVMRARLDGRRARRIAPLEGRPGRLWESPDGRFLVSVRDLRWPEQLFSTLLRITDVEQGTSTTRRARAGFRIADVAPDGAHILVQVRRSSEEPPRLRLITLGEGSRTIGRSWSLDNAFTADSSRIVYLAERPDRSTIAVVDSDGGRPTPLVSGDMANRIGQFAVSDTTERLVYVQRVEAAPSNEGQLRVIDLPTAD